MKFTWLQDGILVTLGAQTLLVPWEKLQEMGVLFIEEAFQYRNAMGVVG